MFDRPVKHGWLVATLDVHFLTHVPFPSRMK
jgi:hypothetical protein